MRQKEKGRSEKCSKGVGDTFETGQHGASRGLAHSTLHKAGTTFLLLSPGHARCSMNEQKNEWVLNS